MRNLPALVGTLLMLLLAACARPQLPEGLEQVDFRSGDILFRLGYGSKSTAVVTADQEGVYSHTGIVVQRDGEIRVVHITPGEREQDRKRDLIKCESVASFFAPSRAKSGAVYRLKRADGGEGEQQGAASRVSADSITLKAALAAVKYADAQVEFDSDYDLEDEGKLYCTELVWRCFLLAGEDITQGRRSELEGVPVYSGSYIFPSDIMQNPQLELIYEYKKSSKH